MIIKRKQQLCVKKFLFYTHGKIKIFEKVVVLSLILIKSFLLRYNYNV